MYFAVFVISVHSFSGLNIILPQKLETTKHETWDGCTGNPENLHYSRKFKFILKLKLCWITGLPNYGGIWESQPVLLLLLYNSHKTKQTPFYLLQRSSFSVHLGKYVSGFIHTLTLFPSLVQCAKNSTSCTLD